MHYHKHKRILVGVTGGIAAYKSPELVRRLKDRGCDVRVVMSQAATAFITPLTLQAVSGRPVHRHLLDTEAESGMGHIELARWADHIVVAPATANFIAMFANGHADDLLSTLVIATTAKISVAPAMNQQMWQHPASQQNIATLVQRGIEIIGPGSGNQACGEVGPGRMTAPAQIAEIVAGAERRKLLAEKKVMLTAGPTWEAIDPVRVITNRSSGKMGFALAEAAADLGAAVTLVSGPVHLDTPPNIKRVDVVSAAQMLQAVLDNIENIDIFIGVAAVSDYLPKSAAEHKIKKTEKSDAMTIEMVKTPDILATVAALARPPFTVGFAAETRDVVANARKKLANKKVNMVAANNVAGEDGAFGNDRNAVVLVCKNGETAIAMADKYAVAMQLLEHIAMRHNESIQQ